MRTAGAGFSSMLNQELTTIATLWKITKQDGSSLYFTDHSEDLVHLGNTYSASEGFSSSSFSAKSDFSVGSIDVQGFLSVSGITEEDIASGYYDYAFVEIKLLNYLGDLDVDFMIVTQGNLGEVSTKKEFFLAEIRGISERIQRQIGQLYSASCRAILGDAKCKFNVAAGTTVQGVSATQTSESVTTVTNRQTFFMTSLSSIDRNTFSGGEIHWLTGLNAGLKMEIKLFSYGKITLVLPMPNEITIGDTADVIVGCDKKFSTCSGKFNNAVNFRGEPHVPGMDKILETASNNTGLL